MVEFRIRPKNWTRFQHYTNRRPPWIKLHRDLLDDRAFTALSVASRALAPFLWLLASESDDGSLSGEVAEIAFRLRRPEKEVKSGLDQLLATGFFEVASGVLADCLQVAPESCSETEGEGETEGERTASAVHARRIAPQRPEDVSEQVWQDWKAHRKAKRATVSQTVLDRLRKDATAAGMTLEAAMAYTVAQGHQGFFPPAGKGGGTVAPRLVAMSTQHIPNMPLGAASCQCQGCVDYRSRRAAP